MTNLTPPAMCQPPAEEQILLLSIFRQTCPNRRQLRLLRFGIKECTGNGLPDESPNCSVSFLPFFITHLPNRFQVLGSSDEVQLYVREHRKQTYRINDGES